MSTTENKSDDENKAVMPFRDYTVDEARKLGIPFTAGAKSVRVYGIIDSSPLATDNKPDDENKGFTSEYVLIGGQWLLVCRPDPSHNHANPTPNASPKP